ncbi:histidine kinase [Rothia sp. P13129]|uniref:sensor histidine kinase n=1 Tax=Rothia sp. P13129 TaxID=3402664 RepID=UPI003AC57CA0
MDHRGSSETLDAVATEGRRLVLQRRGVIRRWIHENTFWVNLFWVFNNLLFVFLELLFSSDSEIFDQDENVVIYFCVAFFFAAGIFWREKFPVLLICLSICVDFLQLQILQTIFISPTGITFYIFLYSAVVKYPFKKSLPIFIATSIFIVVLGFIYYPYIYAGISRGGPSDGSYDSRYVIISYSVLGFLTLSSLLMNLVVFLVARQVHKNRLFDQEIILSFDKTQKIAAIEERHRIAREMHDVVAHSLTVMIALADGAQAISSKDPQRTSHILKELSDTGRSALADMRETLGVLRDESPQQLLSPIERNKTLGIDNLKALVDSFGSTGLPVSFSQQGQNLPEDSQLHMTLYRIIQESLTNALRYAQDAHIIEVLIKVNLPDIVVIIANDGTSGIERRGISRRQNSVGSGKGLIGIQERVAAYHGSLHAGSNDRGGWTVRAHLLWESTSRTKDRSKTSEVENNARARK